jgi:hypothetical protein
MGPFEIWDAEWQWQDCADRRPWLIVPQRKRGLYACFPFSGSAYEGSCFEVSADDPDFPPTGLAKGCFIHDRHIFELPEGPSEDTGDA